LCEKYGLKEEQNVFVVEGGGVGVRVVGKKQSNPITGLDRP
jgi:hypothetical protein